MRAQVTDDPHEEALAWVALIAATLLVTAIALSAVLLVIAHAQSIAAD